MLKVSSLTKTYSGTVALRDVDLEIPAGAVFGLLGPNGAGKTTLLKLLMGFIFPDRGEITRQVPGTQLGYMPERPAFPETSRVDDYLRTAGSLAGLHGAALSRAVASAVERVGLQEVSRKRIAACSRGMRQRLAVAQALLGDPPVLLLDEPAAGLDPAGQVQMRNLIVTLQQAGKTILLSTHQLNEVAQICTHVAVLSAGRVRRQGPLSQVLAIEPQVHILVDNLAPELAAEALALVPGLTLNQRQLILIGPAIQYKAALLRLLLERAVDIQGLVQQQASLEEIYLEAIRS